MKTLAELAEIREKNKNKIALRHGLNNIRIVVGMGTCGIAAGARDVLGTFVDEINGTDLIETVTVTQSGCMGDCENEPVVQIIMPEKETVTYVHMNADKAKEVVSQHIKGAGPVAEYMKK